MKKNPNHHRFLSLLIAVLILTNQGFVSVVSAQEAETPKVIETCFKDFPEFEAKDKNYFPLGRAEDQTLVTTNDFLKAAEKAGDRYHRYMECIFNEASKEILREPLSDLLKPSVACIDPAALVEKTNQTSPNALLPFVLQAYNAYSAYLGNLYNQHTAQLEVKSAERFQEDYDRLRQVKRSTENEIEHALVALHTAFRMFSEMRQVYVIHTHLQCMLKNLEDYRKLIEKLRSVVELIPGRIIDASKSK